MSRSGKSQKKEDKKPEKEVEGLGILNVEVPTQSKKPDSMARLCTCFFLCQHKKFARDKENQGKPRVDRPDVFSVLRHAEARKSKK